VISLSFLLLLLLLLLLLFHMFSIGPMFSVLKGLRVLKAQHNLLVGIDELVLCSLQNLTLLDLSHNSLESLPSSVGELTSLIGRHQGRSNG
jgi:Leucine-rich repeat (LRR) protein